MIYTAKKINIAIIILYFNSHHDKNKQHSSEPHRLDRRKKTGGSNPKNQNLIFYSFIAQSHDL